VPNSPSVSRSVIGSLATEFRTTMVPVAKLARRTDRLPNASWFTGTKSAGGLSTTARIAVQSCCAQADR
jgi:hypothetical protein